MCKANVNCKACNNEVDVQINGHDVALNPFVGRIFASVINALLQELKGVEKGEVQITTRL